MLCYPQKLRNSEPKFEISSDKSSEQLAMCISEGWENTNVLGGSPVVNYRLTSYGNTVSLVIGGSISHLADIKSTPKGSTVSVYSDVPVIGMDLSLTVVLNCQS